MNPLIKEAGERGRTLLELLNYAYERVYQKKCIDGTTRIDRIKVMENDEYTPAYVRLWKVKTKVNGYAHTELP